MHYHHHSLGVALNKYQILFTAKERSSLVYFMTSYQGDKVEDSGMLLPPNHKKVVKGYHSNDIALYIKIKKQVIEDQKHAKLVISEMDEAAKTELTTGSFPNNVYGILPFTFYFPELQSSIKQEASMKWKYHSISQLKACVMPMELDEGEVFDSSTPNNILSI
jgi:hypothetical protein